MVESPDKYSRRGIFLYLASSHDEQFFVSKEHAPL